MKIDIYNTDKKYNIIYADPPWSYKTWSEKKKKKKSAENHYVCMKGYEGYCLGNFIKYIWRYNNKNGWEDIDKAIFYLDELVAEQTK